MDRPPRPTPTAPVVQFIDVSKTFGQTKAVKRISFDIEPGEFFSILGPSGCGKTTTLRLLAGFEQPDEDGGEIRILGDVVNRRRPYERNISMVFQNYALFPHLTVERNVAFGLEQRKVPQADIATRVTQALDMVRLPPDTFGRRKPAELSGGQRQRVALARALVLEPPILLLDEPLGALDLKLRKEMQFELKALNKRLGITFVYVTHDQEEALTMSDRIAVMDSARVAQLGTPAEIYEHPRTAFVARFIGESNFLHGELAGRDGDHATVRIGDATFEIHAPEWLPAIGPITVSVRPERVALRPLDERPPVGHNTLPVTVRQIVYRGEMLHVRVALPDGHELTAAVRNEGQLRRPVAWSPGDTATLTWYIEDGRALEEDRA
ncbi:MAG: ABC transporter ATP-binding protein [Myxococcales bacterium]|nr:ABC transporter ATP-binding protein [Myxococcales bacterium]MCB9553953.1 ABC transporter ATP-binding protein [Myxococcales bacterium]